MDLCDKWYAHLLAVSSYVPDRVLTNKDLEKMVDTSDEWISSRTGISERRIVDSDQSTSDLAANAAKKALEKANLDPKDLDLIIVATSSSDMLFPSTACFVQKKIGASKAVAFDISAACTGYVYGIAVASSFIESGQYKKVMLIGADSLSKYIDWEDRNTCVLFGDGAGALILSATKEKRGVLKSHLCSDAQFTDLLYLPGAKSGDSQTIKMKGNEVFKIAVNTMVDSAQKILDQCGVTPKDVACVVPHQANIRIIKAVSKRLGLDDKIVYTNVERFGNTAAATIGIALDEVIENSLVSKGDLILFFAFGAGFTSGSVLLKL
ncbi:3-oxoacyl-ACP synthase [PVC group bacterium (ex Bugula neritina AB1)]|nr:3-oxoacyl-ACP synthase [PVC group bacterium (ex Bugula neritina AB1)]